MRLNYLSEDTSTFIEDIECAWKNSFNLIESALKSKNLPPFNVKVKFSTETTFHDAHSFFTSPGSYRQGRRFMEVTVVSDLNCKPNLLMKMI